jgi:hypothetical protein
MFMTRQQTLESIQSLLPTQPTDKLEAVLEWLEQEDDDFEARVRADSNAGKFDALIAQVIAEDDAGETIELEASCE